MRTCTGSTEIVLIVAASSNHRERTAERLSTGSGARARWYSVVQELPHNGRFWEGYAVFGYRFPDGGNPDLCGWRQAGKHPGGTLHGHQWMSTGTDRLHMQKAAAR